MISIYTRRPDPSSVDRRVLETFYRRESNADGAASLHRIPEGPSRGFMRILFPRFPVEVRSDEGAPPSYRVKPDLLASFFVLVFVAVGVVWLVAPDSAGGSPWIPLAFAGWFVILAVRNVVYAKKSFDVATSGLTLSQLRAAGSGSSPADQVLAMLEQTEDVDKAD